MPPVVFIHGAWMTPLCWEGFQSRFETQGYKCLAPAWPYDDRSVEGLRANPAPELAGLGVTDIVNHYASIIAGLDEPPILVGHSLGGLFVELLLDRGLGVAGIAIDPAPPRGVLPGPKALKASFHAIRRWRAWRRTLTIPFERFRWGFVHAQPEDEQRAVYERHVVPTPGRLFFQAAFGRGTRVNFSKNDRAPLLLIAGKLDRTVTPGMVRAAHRKYRRSTSITELREFPARTHWLLAAPGWEEIADSALEWLRTCGLSP